jgi:tetratricopeptide (TPR) repeat protein
MIKRYTAILLAVCAFTAAASAQLKPKTKAEYDALNKMFSATNLDERIAAGEEIIAGFANTDFKSVVLFTIADAYSRKNDDAKTIVYGERALEADPKDYQASLLLATVIARKIRENDLDKDERLAQAEKYAKQAMDIIPTAPKPNAQMTDDQWAESKKDLMADGSQALGMVAMVRKKYDEAVTDFKASVEGAKTPDPAAMVRLAQAENKAGKYDDAIAMAEKVMAIPDVNPSIKQFAQAEKVRAFQGKQTAK